MNGYDIEKTIQELQEQIDNNNQQNLVNDERSRMARANQFSTKAEETITFSILPYLGLNAASMFLFYNGTMAHITSTIPPESIPLIITGGSLVLGNLTRILIDKRFQIVERIKSFSKAKTESEKIEEQIRYEIEQEKIKIRNRAIERAIKTIRENQEKRESLSQDYIISNKNMPLSTEEAKTRIEELSNIINQKFKGLDIKTTRLVLNNNYNKIKTGLDDTFETSAYAMISGATVMMYYSIPVISMSGLMGEQNMVASATSVLGPLAVGTVGSAAYLKKNKKDLDQALNRINDSLGNDKISRDKSFDYKLSLALDVDRKVEEVSSLIVDIYIQKRALEKFIVNQSISKPSKIEEEGSSLLLRRTIEE